MTDYFALLRQPRRPWLDPSALKDAYLARSKEVHPDKSSQAEGAAAELNAAYHCLRNPRTRILHLVELETGQPPEIVQSIPPELTDFFMRMTRIMRETDAFLREWSAATGLVKAQLFEAAQDWIEKLQATQGEINGRLAEAEKLLLSLDEAWLQTRSGVITGLLEAYQIFSYYGRWSSQIQEKLARLAA